MTTIERLRNLIDETPDAPVQIFKVRGSDLIKMLDVASAARDLNKAINDLSIPDAVADECLEALGNALTKLEAIK